MRCSKCNRVVKKYRRGRMCGDCINTMQNNWRKNLDPERLAIMNEKSRLYQQTHKDRWNEYKRGYCKAHRVQHSLYTSVRHIIRNYRPARPTLKILGLPNRQALLTHLENTIPSGYSFNDYGSILCIDHITPLSKYDHSDPEQVKKAWHYTNIRLITKYDNAKKAKNNAT